MKKIVIISLLLSFFVILYIGIVVGKDNIGRSTKNEVAYIHKQYKEKCDIFDGNEDGSRIYRDEQLGFQFEYTDSTIVCVRHAFYDTDADALEITIWGRSDFFSDLPTTGPLAIIHINRDNFNFPKLTVESREKITIGNIDAVAKHTRSPYCTNSQCPAFRVYEFSHDGYKFIIQEREEINFTLVDEFKFLGTE